MPYLAAVFLFVALCAGVMGYGMEPDSYEDAKVLCFAFIILALLVLCGRAARRSTA